MQKLARLLPDAAVVTISNAGHDVHLEAVKALVRQLKRFLPHASPDPA